MSSKSPGVAERVDYNLGYIFSVIELDYCLLSGSEYGTFSLKTSISIEAMATSGRGSASVAGTL